MSTYKIYQIIDANKSTYSFRLPESKKHVDFLSMTFGSKFADGKLTYGTADPEIQAAIENLSKFKSGVITIEREVEQEISTDSVTDKPKADTSKQQAASRQQPEGKKGKKGKKGNASTGSATNSKSSVTGATAGSVTDASTGSATDNGGGMDNEVIEELTTVQEAKDWLKTTKGIAPIALSTFEKVKAQAEKAGVTFPNVVWPE